MRASSILSSLSAIGLGVITPIIIRQIWILTTHHFRKYKEIKKKSESTVVDLSKNTKSKANAEDSYDDFWNTALFFPCLRGDDPTTSINRLLLYLNQAEKSIKICVMTVSFDPIFDLLINKHQSGIDVRFFTSFYTATGRKAKKLKQKGVPVRSRRKGQYSTEMHNKYVILDDKAVFTGSMNWTVESIYRQRENILITNHSRILPKFLKHFDLMWINFWDENIDVEGNRLDIA